MTSLYWNARAFIQKYTCMVGYDDKRFMLRLLNFLCFNLYWEINSNFFRLTYRGKTCDDNNNRLQLRVLWFELTMLLPPIIKDYNEIVREYGVVLYSNYLKLYYGLQHHSSDKQKLRMFIINWFKLRHIVRYAIVPIYREREIEHAECSTIGAVFTVKDYDSEEVDVLVLLWENVYRRGKGIFTFLGYILPKRKMITVNLHFSKEFGKDKNTWGGGILETTYVTKDGIDDHLDVLSSYCEKNEAHLSVYHGNATLSQFIKIKNSPDPAKERSTLELKKDYFS